MTKKHQEFVAKEGWIFLFPLIGLALVSAILRGPILLTGILAVLAFYVAYFFRNPHRTITDDPKAIVSPADGKVVGVHRLEDGRHLISVFLNIFNVHVNRCPIAGNVERVAYQKGAFLAAYKEEASELNEQNRVVIKDGDFQVDVIQIAGLIARRIVCWVGETDRVARGERFGLIRFGSRVDIILTGDIEVHAKTGQKIKGGSDILAMRKSPT